MRELSASEFKAKCLAIIDEVGESGTRVVVSKRGKRVAELIRYAGVEDEIPQESLRGTAHLEVDITGPAVDSDAWRSLGRQ
ncbi:MAG: type II toxin-antitoxin system Phd/YefM family antitoxin [Spirochaetota bacterium]